MYCHGRFACVHVCTRACIYSCVHTRARAHTHTHNTTTHIHTHTHTHTHRRRPNRGSAFPQQCFFQASDDESLGGGGRGAGDRNGGGGDGGGGGKGGGVGRGQGEESESLWRGSEEASAVLRPGQLLGHALVISPDEETGWRGGGGEGGKGDGATGAPGLALYARGDESPRPPKIQFAGVC